MQRNLVWKGLDADTTENCAVNFFTDHITVRSEISGWYQMQAVKVDYYIRLNNRWKAEEFEVIAQIGSQAAHIYAMQRAADGEWNNRDFVNCDYIDISLTPFTNTLPINGLGLNNGKAAYIDVVYIDIMENIMKSARQQYSKLDRLTYRFENEDGTFTADINVDEEGFVTDYPGLFESI